MSEALGDFDDFLDVCEQQAWFYAEGLIDLQIAVDNLQFLAERWGLIDLYGQEAIQEAMAFLPPAAPVNYAEEILRRWELAPPIPTVPVRAPNSPPRVPQSTVDAFKYVIGLGDPVYLAKWLRNHSDVASALLKQLPEAA